ncbi:MAG TPA: endonuclease [Flavobacteriales bacterium]
MEGPSLHLAAEQLQPFVGKRVKAVFGNTTIDQERLKGQVVQRIFAWGKHLVIQFDGSALRVHFLLFGSFEADVLGITVTGDYKRSREPRLALTFPNGELRTYTCSVVHLETKDARKLYDRSVDVLARQWDPQQALERMGKTPDERITDVLLDQEVFAGVGNIIKNEVLSLERVHPATPIKDLRPAQRKALVKRARTFSQQFLRWRRAFVLLKHLRIHRKSRCPHCDGPVKHEKVGKRKRMAHYCPKCQPLGKT